MADKVQLADLVGYHTLDGVEMRMAAISEWSDQDKAANAIAFRLDGVTYVATENESDGYRSSMRDLVVSDEPPKTVFPPTAVLVRNHYSDDQLLEFIDIGTGEVVLEVGTDHSDDYYPNFVASFRPENLSVNQPKKEPEVVASATLDGYGEWA